jgi:hypothetical protein
VRSLATSAALAAPHATEAQRAKGFHGQPHIGHGVDRWAGGGYFWSEQCGARIRFAGSIIPSDDVRVVEGAPADTAFLATYHEEDDTCRNCSSAEHGATRWQEVGTTSSTPSTRA